MREIKFRGRRLDNGEWVYGYLVESNMSKAFIVQMNHLGGLVNCDRICPGSIGEYTNLRDKSGNEIYAGDIVEVEAKRVSTGTGWYQTVSMTILSGYWILKIPTMLLC